MKTHFNFSMLILFFMSLLFMACEVDEITPAGTEEAASTQKLVPELPKVEQNYLVFEDIQHFHATSRYLEGKSREFLDQWEDQLGFKSMRYYFDAASDAYEHISDQGHLQAFKQKYAGKVNIAEDGTLEMGLDIYYMGSLLNTDGLVKIDGSIQYYDKDMTIIVVDGDINKIKEAKQYGISNERKGIFVIEKQILNLSDESLARVGGTNFEETEVKTNGNRNGSRRLRISAKCHVWTQPIYNNGLIPSGQWINFFRIITKAESHEKKWWGWKGRTTDFIETFDYFVSGNIIAGGNGFPRRVTRAKKVETYVDEWEKTGPTSIRICFTRINYNVQGGTQNWATANITY